MNNTINTMNNTTDREGCREGWGELGWEGWDE